jgi:hypothetical protein
MAKDDRAQFERFYKRVSDLFQALSLICFASVLNSVFAGSDWTWRLSGAAVLSVVLCIVAIAVERRGAAIARALGGDFGESSTTSNSDTGSKSKKANGRAPR